MNQTNRQRLLIQYLEPAPVVDAIDPLVARDRLMNALDRLPVTDVAIGWRLRPEVAEAVRGVIPAEVDVWRWVPVFTDSGESQPADAHVAIGPDGTGPAPFKDLADFRFLCLDHADVHAQALERAAALGHQIDADGVLLDRIRWHSPSASPATELTCFCERSRDVAARDGLDLERLGQWLAASTNTLEGRRELVASLLGATNYAPFAEFLEWRSRTVTGAIRELAEGLAGSGLRSALDVFTPALARSVGQQLDTLGPLGEWSKSMTYFEALGPASMPFELDGYRRWLMDMGDPDPAGFISAVLGFGGPGIGGSGAQLEALRHEAAALVAAVDRERAVVGIDAVQIPGVCEVRDKDLMARLRELRTLGLGASPCWELLLIDEARIEAMAQA